MTLAEKLTAIMEFEIIGGSVSDDFFNCDDIACSECPLKGHRCNENVYGDALAPYKEIKKAGLMEIDFEKIIKENPELCL